MKESSLSRKFISLVCVCFLFITISFSVLSYVLINYYSKKIAYFQGIIQAKNILNFLSKKVLYLKSIATDWAKWDDTYNFMKDKNINYIKSNFEGPTLEDLNLNLFLFLKNKKLFFGRGYDEEKRMEFTLENIPKNLNLFLKKIPFNKPCSGFFVLNKNIYLFASHPILTSKGDGPSRGTIFIAKKLSPVELKKEFLHADFKVSYNSLDNRNFIGNLKFLSTKTKVFVVSRKEMIKLKLLILNPYDSSSFVLECDLSISPIIKTGFLVAKIFIAFSFLSLLVFMGVIYKFLYLTFIKRLKKLSDSVSKIDPDIKESIKLPSFSEREFKILSSSIENMLKKYTEEKRLFENIFNLSRAGMVIHDLKNCLLVNKYLLQLTGYSEEEISKVNIFDVFHPEDREYVEKLVKENFNKKEPIFYEARIITKENKIVHVAINSVTILYKNQKVRLASIIDISSIKEAEFKIKNFAFFDSLTGLYNKNYLQKIIEDISKDPKNKTAILILIDIKNFSLINFYWGFLFGNKVLKAIGNEIKKHLREKDYGFRLEADKFGILIVNISHQIISSRWHYIFERIKNGLSTKLTINGRELDVEVYVAGSIYPDVTKDIQKLIEHSEIALTIAKKEKNVPYLIFKNEMEEKIKHRVNIERLLKRAITQDEFFLNYQPVFHVKNKKIVQLEALIRWNNQISPNEFIPVAEESGLIVDITKIIIKKACKQIKEWNKVYKDKIKVAVNISALDFKHPYFLNHLKENILFYGIDPGQFELEITERILVENNEFSLKMLKELKFMGFSIAIDDFGTGYSSLSYLSQFPLDILKIDLSFVQRIGKRKEDEAIVETIINLGHSLNLKVLAEGVETKEQFEFLKSKRCDYVQGYYFARPLPPKEITELLLK